MLISITCDHVAKLHRYIKSSIKGVVKKKKKKKKKKKFFKELTPRSQTNELCGQGEKNVQNQDKQTPHTVLQKLSPKKLGIPLNSSWKFNLSIHFRNQKYYKKD